MGQNQPYREQIDACRPGSDDLALLALADLARAAESDRAVAGDLARSQRFDRSVAAAMHDVPLPAGLLERLEAQLAAGEAVEDEATGEPVSLPVSAAEPGSRSRISRRGLWAAAASLAVVALLAIGGMFLPRAPRHVTSNELAEMAG